MVNRISTAEVAVSIDLLGPTAVAVHPGNQHICVILDNRDLKCWGDGTVGRWVMVRDINATMGLHQLFNTAVNLFSGRGR